MVKVLGLLQVSFPLGLLDLVTLALRGEGGREGIFSLCALHWPELSSWGPKFEEAPLLSSCVTLDKLGSSLCTYFLISSPCRVSGYVNVGCRQDEVSSITIDVAGMVIPFPLSFGPRLSHSASPGQATSQSQGLGTPP